MIYKQYFCVTLILSIKLLANLEEGRKNGYFHFTNKNILMIKFILPIKSVYK